MTHTCKCGETDLSKFSRHAKSKTGYQKLCKVCFRKEYWSPRKRMYYGVTCKVEGCASDAVAKEMCRKHYKQVYDHNTTYQGKARTWKNKPKPVIKPTDGIPWPISEV